MDPAVDFDGDDKHDPDLMFLLRECDKDNNIIIFEKGGRLGGENGAEHNDRGREISTLFYTETF